MAARSPWQPSLTAGPSAAASQSKRRRVTPPQASGPARLHNGLAQLLEQARRVLNSARGKLPEEEAGARARVVAWAEKVVQLHDDQLPEILFTVLGEAGKGKTTAIEAVLDETALLPTMNMEACTSVPVKLGYRSTDGYEVHVNLKSKAVVEAEMLENWHNYVHAYQVHQATASNETWRAAQEQDDSLPGHSRQEAKSRASSELRNAEKMLTCVYGTRAVSSAVECLQHGSGDEGLQTLLATTNTITKLLDKVDADPSSAPVLSKGTAPLMKGALQTWVADSAFDPRDLSLRRFPVVATVEVYHGWQLLEGGLAIVDLPGSMDILTSRDKAAHTFLQALDWKIVPCIVADIARARSNPAAKVLMRDVCIRKDRDAEVFFLATMADNLFSIASLETSQGVAYEEARGSHPQLWAEVQHVERLQESERHKARAEGRAPQLGAHTLRLTQVHALRRMRIVEADMRLLATERELKGLQPFSVSALNYQKLLQLGTLHEATPFRSKDETGMPALQAALRALKDKRAEEHRKQLGERALGVIQTAANALQDLGAPVSVTASEIAQRAIVAIRTHLTACKVLAGGDNADLSLPARVRLDLGRAMAKAVADARSVGSEKVKEWLHRRAYTTIWALCDGRGFKAKKPTLDLNEVLAGCLDAPRKKWEQFFAVIQNESPVSQVIWAILDRLEDAMRQGLEAMIQQLAQCGCPPPVLMDAKAKRGQVMDMFRRMERAFQIKEVTLLKNELGMVYPGAVKEAIQTSMVPAYEECGRQLVPHACLRDAKRCLYEPAQTGKSFQAAAEEPFRLADAAWTGSLQCLAVFQHECEELLQQNFIQFTCPSNTSRIGEEATELRVCAGQLEALLDSYNRAAEAAGPGPSQPSAPAPAEPDEAAVAPQPAGHSAPVVPAGPSQPAGTMGASAAQGPALAPAQRPAGPAELSQAPGASANAGPLHGGAVVTRQAVQLPSSFMLGVRPPGPPAGSTGRQREVTTGFGSSPFGAAGTSAYGRRPTGRQG